MRVPDDGESMEPSSEHRSRRTFSTKKLATACVAASVGGALTPALAEANPPYWSGTLGHLASKHHDYFGPRSQTSPFTNSARNFSDGTACIDAHYSGKVTHFGTQHCSPNGILVKSHAHDTRYSSPSSAPYARCWNGGASAAKMKCWYSSH